VDKSREPEEKEGKKEIDHKSFADPGLKGNCEGGKKKAMMYLRTLFSFIAFVGAWRVPMIDILWKWAKSRFFSFGWLD